jgi:lysophospholipase L1-like esterase
MSVQVSYKKQFIFGIFLICIIITGLEISFRTYEIINPICAFMDKDVFSNTDYLLVRSICLDHNKIIYEKNTIQTLSPNQHGNTFNINSYGFRGQEVTFEKPENTYRIFMVGGSTTFGSGATSDDTTIPAYLQKQFNNFNLNSTVEVINAGISGADSASESYHITNYLIDFKPDLFIIYDGWNDAVNPIKHINHEKEKRTLFEFKNFPFYRTPFVIYDIFFKDHKNIIHPIVNPDLIPVKTDLWKKRWLDICQVNENMGIKTIIIVQPILGTGNKTLSLDEAFMVAKLIEHKVPFEILNSFSNELPNLEQRCEKTMDLRNIYDNIKEPLYFDMVHVSDKGNEIVANKIYDEILPIVIEDIENSP